MSFNKTMLPANVSFEDDIFIEEKVTRPVALVINNPPKLLNTTPTSPSGSAEEPKVISAELFPKLRGFV